MTGKSKLTARIKTAYIEQQGMGHGLVTYLIALMARSCLGMNSGIIFASDMG